MKNNNRIENLFQKAFSDFKVKPSKKVWKGVRKNLMWKNFFHFRWDTPNIFYVTGILLIAAGFWVLIDKMPLTPGLPDIEDRTHELSDTTEKKTIPEVSPEQEKTDTKKLTEKKSEEPEENEPEVSFEEKEIVIAEDKPAVADISDSLLSEKPKKKPLAPAKEDELPLPARERRTDSLSRSYSASPKAFFIPTAFEGCVPLQVQFISNSSDAIEYNWSFGDGGISDKENPIYVFDEPGNYFVSLTIRSEENEVSSYSEVITAHPNPIALFEIDIDELPGTEQPVYFYNYSRAAVSYQWDFGDGTGSELKEPLKYYENEGDYDIMLVAISEYGCRDSIILRDAFSSDEPEIVFPNAFTPNPDGPIGGYYSTYGNDNEVFHPYMPEQPLEYTLRIFNKKGNPIFESKDPAMGWDGYYLQELQPQGVYIYKVKAIFKNGQQVVKIGDITLIHQRDW